jgi:hypothetical protein
MVNERWEALGTDMCFMACEAKDDYWKVMLRAPTVQTNRSPPIMFGCHVFLQKSG